MLLLDFIESDIFGFFDGNIDIFSVDLNNINPDDGNFN